MHGCKGLNKPTLGFLSLTVLFNCMLLLVVDTLIKTRKGNICKYTTAPRKRCYVVYLLNATPNWGCIPRKLPKNAASFFLVFFNKSNRCHSEERCVNPFQNIQSSLHWHWDESHIKHKAGDDYLHFIDPCKSMNVPYSLKSLQLSLLWNSA